MKPNLNEPLLLIGSLCLQETFLKENVTIRNFTSYSYIYIYNNTDRALGGTSILINYKILQHRILLNTNFQVVVASATLYCTKTVCSLYIPPHDQTIDTELDQLLQQFPRPFILMGDFNSNNIIWGCKEINKKGKILEKIIYNNNLCLLFMGMQTYVNLSRGNTTAIDLTICDPSIYIVFSWQVHENTCGSNRISILLNNTKPTRKKNTPLEIRLS